MKYVAILSLVFCGIAHAQPFNVFPNNAAPAGGRYGDLQFNVNGILGGASPSTYLGYTTPQQSGTVYKDTQQQSLSVTVSGTSLAVSAPTFSATDVGKYIVIQGAGTQQTTGSVSAIALTTQGIAGTAIPTCTITDSNASPGQNAACVAQWSVNSSTLPVITAGGSGFPASSTFNLTLACNLAQTSPVISVTTNSSGVITTVNSVVTPGLCSNPPGAFSSGFFKANATGSTGTGEQFTVTMNVTGILAVSGGYGYHSGTTMAVLSGWTGGTAPVAGAVTTTTPSLPLATTIASFTDNQHVTLATGAGTALSASTELVTWGHDDCPAINAAMTAASGGNGNVYVPGGMYGCATPLVKPATSVFIYGAGKGMGGTTIITLAPLLAEMLEVNDNGSLTYPQPQRGSMLDHIALDANDLSPITLDVYSSDHFQIGADVDIRNAAFNATFSSNVAIGRGGVYYAAVVAQGTTVKNPQAGNPFGMINDPSLMPLHNWYDNGADSQVSNIEAENSLVSSFYVSAGGQGYVNNHAFGYPFGYYPAYCFYFAGNTRAEGNTCDGAGKADYHIGYNFYGTDNGGKIIGQNGTGMEVLASAAYYKWGGGNWLYLGGGSDQSLVVNPNKQNMASGLIYGNTGASQVENDTFGLIGYKCTITLAEFSNCYGYFDFIGGNNSQGFGYEVADYYRNGGTYNASVNRGLGKGQTIDFTMQGTSTSTTPVGLFTDLNGAATASNEANLSNPNTTQLVQIDVNAVCQGTSNMYSASWTTGKFSVYLGTTGNVNWGGASPVAPTFTLSSAFGSNTAPSGWAPAIALDATNQAAALTGAGACPSGTASVFWTAHYYGLETQY